MESNWAPWMLGLSSSKLGAATTTNFGSMFRRTKFTIYYSLCCANGTPVETTPSMNFGLFAKRKESTRVEQLAIAIRIFIPIQLPHRQRSERASLLHFRTPRLRPKYFIPGGQERGHAEGSRALVWSCCRRSGRLPQLWQQRTNIWRRVTN